jgi:hypothetical protein
MKYILVLALVVACTSKEKKVEIAAPAEAPSTESEAKPVSPYTVQPCYCMKIFKPVCAGGMNYGNSCEAECHGHKTWTEGNCGKK